MRVSWARMVLIFCFSLPITAQDIAGAASQLQLNIEAEEIPIVKQSIDVVAEGPPFVGAVKSATRTDTLLRDIPQSVDVVPARVIESQAALSVQDVLRNVSGVSLHMGEGRRDQVYIRGFSALNDQFIDGIRDDAPYYRDLSNIEQVEVLKGPASMLFGRGSSGGIIHRVTKRPNAERPIVEFGVTTGSYGARRITGDLGQSYAAGALAWRLTGAGEKSGSFRDRFSLDRRAISPSLAWRIGPRTSLLTQAEHLSDERLPDRGIPALNGLPAPVRAGAYFGDPAGDWMRNRVFAQSAAFDHQFSENVALFSQSRHSGYANDFRNTYPNGALSSGGVTRILRAGYRGAANQQNYFHHSGVVANLRAARLEHRLLTGVELGRQTRESWRFNSTASPVDLFAPVLTPAVYSAVPANANRFAGSTVGFYVQDQVSIARRWKLLAGVRRDRFSQGLVDWRPNQPALSRVDGVWSPRVGAVFQALPSVSFYGTVSRSFQPSGEALTLAVSTADLGPETTINLEGGIKSELLGGRLLLTAAVFDLRRNNVRTPDPVDFSRLILAGSQRARGAEASITGSITRRWSVLAGYAWLDTRILKSNDSVEGVLLQGNRLGHIPVQSANLWSTVRLAAGLSAGFGFHAAGRRFTANDNLVAMPAYQRFDGALFWRRARWELALNLRNLTNRGYYESAHGTYTIMPGAPVNGLLTLRYRR